MGRAYKRRDKEKPAKKVAGRRNALRSCQLVAKALLTSFEPNLRGRWEGKKVAVVLVQENRTLIHLADGRVIDLQTAPNPAPTYSDLTVERMNWLMEQVKVLADVGRVTPGDATNFDLHVGDLVRAASERMLRQKAAELGYRLVRDDGSLPA